VTALIRNIVVATLTITALCGPALSQQRKCVSDAQPVPIAGNIDSKVEAYASTMAQNKLYLGKITCDLGKPDIDLVFDGRFFISTPGAIPENGERYVSYGDARTDRPLSKNALVFIFNEEGFVRIMERYYPKEKRFWGVKLEGEPGKVAVSFGHYTRNQTKR